ncbi:MAG: hypothetical protein A2252_06030 [Elusimicrobia bacterium RIFOXYA2_FULL_39_19]|nr:MAG: hypothetical protein A2252_06030 [Elusimicrobia bacterium RIFOXYA2_FULL_39_19]
MKYLNRLPRHILIQLLALIFVFFLCSCISLRLLHNKKRYIFIDGGAHYGESIIKFENTKLFSKYPWEIIAIEANPEVINRIPKQKNIKIINKAIWINKGKIEFFITDNDSLSSLFKDNKPSKAVQIPCFDFSKWLKNNFTENDHVILSFDIQGAEYEVFRKMLKEDTFKLIDRLCVEMHTDHTREQKEENRNIDEDEILLDRIRSTGCIVSENSAEHIIETHWKDYFEGLIEL